MKNFLFLMALILWGEKIIGAAIKECPVYSLSLDYCFDENYFMDEDEMIEEVMQRIVALKSPLERRSLNDVISFIEKLLFHRDDVEALLKVIESLEDALSELKNDLQVDKH